MANAIKDVDNPNDDSIKDVENLKDDSIKDVENLKDDSIKDVENLKDDAIKGIENSKDNATRDVENPKNNAIKNVENPKNNAIKNIENSKEMMFSSSIVESGIVESTNPLSITIDPYINPNFDQVDKPRQDQEARHASIDERFFNAPIVIPIKKISKWKTWSFAFQTLGVVYGDLSTSVLYVYPSISSVETPNEEDYLGILSVIFWTLTLIGVFKYTFIILYSDDHGEGGTFAMYSLLCQHMKLGGKAKKSNLFTTHMDSQLSHYHNQENRKRSKVRHWLEHHKRGQQVLLFFVMLGTCMLIGDGVLTPAISAHALQLLNFLATRLYEDMKFAIVWSLNAVLSAIGGLQTKIPSINDNVVIWVSAFILVLVFFAQSYGTKKVAFLFSPITAIWLATNTMVGIYNIVKYYPTVFKAFSPHYIYKFFTKHKEQGWRMLGGLVLCITGCESMFADLGHFNRLSIQMAFSLAVYPASILTYAGQTAYLIHHPHDYLEGFYKSIPANIFWPVFIIATLAAIVASQGLITATFSVMKASVALDYFPPLKIVHTSEDTEGQVYSPEVNYGLMVMCLAVVFGFRSSTEIGNAYGVAVVCVMMITTCLMTIIMLVIWDTKGIYVFIFFVVFILIEGSYFSVVMIKIPQGGWLPFLLSIFFTLIMTTWNYGRRKKFDYESKHKLSKKAFGQLLSNIGDHRVSGVCFFYTSLVHGIPPIVSHYVQNVRALHQVLIFTSIRHIPIKTVLPAERFLVGRIGFKGVYRCVARYGYRDLLSAETTYFLDQVTQCLIEHIGSTLDLSENPNNIGAEEERTKEVQMIRQAKAAGAVYVIGRSEFQVKSSASCFNKLFAGVLYPFLDSICRSRVSTLHIPPANCLEVGMHYDLG